MAKSRAKKEAQAELKEIRVQRNTRLVSLEPRFVDALKQMSSINGETIKEITEQALAFHFLDKYHENKKLLDSLKYNSEEVQNAEGYQLWKSQLIVLQSAYSVFANHVDDIVDQMKGKKNKIVSTLHTSIEGNDQ